MKVPLWAYKITIEQTFPACSLYLKLQKSKGWGNFKTLFISNSNQMFVIIFI